MARIVVFGLGPMRFEQSTRLFALALRTWHFASCLARAGHDVLLLSIRGHAYEGWPSEKKTLVERDGVTVWSISEHLCHERPDWIRRRIARFKPDCVVGVNRDPASMAVNFIGQLPFWADVNGDPMAEAQAKARTLGHDDNIAEWHRKFLPVLLRADHFSTCSRAQRLALIGQLGLVGRLTGGNDGTELVTAVPNSIDDEELELYGRIRRKQRKPGDPFVLLSSGGFNTWIDPVVMFDAIERSMKSCPTLSFVSTGGAIPGHHVDAYAQFQELVRKSRYRKRFELAGWVQTTELFGYYEAANAALLVDRFTYEGVLGARTRMLDWLAAGLPIVCTRLSEISEDLERRGIALSAEPGDARALSDAIVELVEDPAGAERRGRRGRRHAETTLRAASQLEPLMAWAKAPARAPDGERRAGLDSLPAPAYEVKKHVVLFRDEARSHGLPVALKKTGQFASRRVKHGLQRAFDGFGFTEEPVQLEQGQVAVAHPIEPPTRSRFEWRKLVSKLKQPPVVAAVVCVRGDEEPDYVDWTLEQVRRQYYPHWRVLVVAPDTLGAGLRERLTILEERFRADGAELVRVPHVADPFAHRAVREADYVIPLAPGDLLRLDAIGELVLSAREADADLVYAYEQDLDESNVPRPVRRKAVWSPHLLFHCSYLGRGVMYRSALLDLPAGRVAAFPFDALVYDLALRAAPRVKRAVCVPVVLCTVHVPALRPEAQRVAQEQEVARLEEQSLREAVWRQGLSAKITRGPRPRTFRVRHDLGRGTRVSIVVPDVGSLKALQRCVRSLASTTLEPELVVATARDLRGKLPRTVRLVRVEEPKTYGALVEAGVLHGASDYVVIAHPGAEAHGNEWLLPLLEEAAAPDVAAVSPKLVSPEGSSLWPPPEVASGWLQHAPILLQCPLHPVTVYCRKDLQGCKLRRARGSEQLALIVGKRLRKRGRTMLSVPYATFYVHGAFDSSGPWAAVDDEDA